MDRAHFMYPWSCFVGTRVTLRIVQASWGSCELVSRSAGMLCYRDIKTFCAVAAVAQWIEHQSVNQKLV